jgi:hypothetical protein
LIALRIRANAVDDGGRCALRVSFFTNGMPEDYRRKKERAAKVIIEV